MAAEIAEAGPVVRCQLAANAASTAIEKQRRGIETRELEQRIQDLEAATGHLPDPKKRAA